jgi:hypothetical protein
MQHPARVFTLALTCAAAMACGTKHHLAEHPFTNRSMAMVYIAPPAPVLLTGWYDLRGANDPVEAVLMAGSGVANEIEGRRASARLDSAASRVDVGNRLAQHTLERASRYLGTRAVTSSNDADYVLEVQMRRFGLDVRGQNAAYLFTQAEAVLLDRRTGREIWSSEVRGTSRLTPFVQGTNRIPSGIITAGTLSIVSVSDFQQALDQLVTFSSALITDELRGDLRETRRR